MEYSVIFLWQKWLFVIVFWFMHMLAEYTTFSAANMIAFHKVNLPIFPLFITETIILLEWELAL